MGRVMNLKKIVSITLLLLVVTSAKAEWISIGKNDSTVMYVDPTTIRKAGGKARIWSLFDFKAAESLGSQSYMSSKSQEEFDCEQETVRTTYLSLHSGRMGSGELKVIEITTAGNPRPV